MGVGHCISKFKLGHIGPNKKGFGSKQFLWPGPGARKVGLPQNMSILKLDFLTLYQGLRPEFKKRIKLWATFETNALMIQLIKI